MNDYTFDTLEIGLTASFETLVTEEMFQAFHLVCGDENPLHINDDYAVEHGYPSKLVWGD